MNINLDYPPQNTGSAANDIEALRAWCVMLLDELNLSLYAISSGVTMTDSEKVVNWK